MRRRIGRIGARREHGWLWLAGGLVAGTALGWMTAPRRGDWMRNQARQKLTHWTKAGRRRLDKRRRDLGNRVQGGVAEMKHAWSGRQPYVDANTLVDQVHSTVGRAFASVLEHVNLNAVGHTVVLHGYVHEAEARDGLIAAIAAVEGVEEVQAAEVRIVPREAAPREAAPAPSSRPRRRRGVEPPEQAAK